MWPRIMSRLKPQYSEFKLSANTYLERFNTCKKRPDQTYVAFASRLKGLLTYYTESRKVTTFDKLQEFLVCDRVTSSFLKNV